MSNEIKPPVNLFLHITQFDTGNENVSSIDVVLCNPFKVMVARDVNGIIEKAWVQERAGDPLIEIECSAPHNLNTPQLEIYLSLSDIFVSED